MNVVIPDDVAEHCPRLLQWLASPTAGAERVASLLENFLVRELGPDRRADSLSGVEVEEDALTGLRTRSQLEEDVFRAVDGLEESADPILETRYLCLNIGHFWRLRANKGHLAGDEAIREFARRLQGHYPAARIYRCYYTEFVVEIGDGPNVDLPLPRGHEPLAATIEVRAGRSTAERDLVRVTRTILLKIEQGLIDVAPGGHEVLCEINVR